MLELLTAIYLLAQIPVVQVPDAPKCACEAIKGECCCQPSSSTEDDEEIQQAEQMMMRYWLVEPQPAAAQPQ